MTLGGRSYHANLRSTPARGTYPRFCSGNNIGGHGFCFLVSAVRTGEDRFRLNSSHVFLAFTRANVKSGVQALNQAAT